MSQVALLEASIVPISNSEHRITVEQLGIMPEGFDAESDVASGIFGFDLETGDLVVHHLGAGSQGMNDVAVAPSGDVYVTGGQLQVLRAGTRELAPVETSPDVLGTNGVAVGPKETTLFVSIYPVGIGAIDLESGQLRYLEAPPGTSLSGIDGLYWHEGDLVGIQNGIQPWRLLRMSLSPDLTTVEDMMVIEFANDAISPMTGAIIEDRIHYIGRGPAPEKPPAHFDASLAPFLGQTVIWTAPLD